MNPIQRVDYDSEALLESALAATPLDQFAVWLADAVAAGIAEPNAMTLATVDGDGQPHARTVLCKEATASGFVFFTNYDSDKGQQIAAHPRVALCFHWQPLHRQVRINGLAGRLDPAASDEYFDSRPRGAQLGAWASEQSQVITDRDVLRRRLESVGEQYESGPIPRPPHWGGYLVTVESIEFWQGQPSRLHDRLRLTRLGDARLDDPTGWQVQRLSP